MNDEATIKKIKTEIERTKKEIEQLETFRTTIQDAVESFQKKKYGALLKAIEEYGSWEQVHTAYGYDCITPARYKRLEDLHREMEKDATQTLTVRFLSQVTSQIETLKKHVTHLKNMLEAAGGSYE